MSARVTAIARDARLCLFLESPLSSSSLLRFFRALLFPRMVLLHMNPLIARSLQDRLSYSAKPELLPLVRLSRDLPPFRARALVDAGYLDPLHVAAADPASLARVLLHCSPFRCAGRDESVVSLRWTLDRQRMNTLSWACCHGHAKLGIK